MSSFDELQRLREGALPDERSSTGLSEITIETSGSSLDCLSRCREVLIAIDTVSATFWPSLQEWRSVLPQWLVQKFKPEPTAQEQRQSEARWKGMPQNERAIEASNAQWSLANWIAWFVPDEREWFWWDAVAKGIDAATIRVETIGYPAPLGSLDWLLRSAGATHVELP